MARSSRRHFLSTAAGLAAVGGFEFLHKLPVVAAEEAQLDATLVRLQPRVEPLTKLIEDTPRERVLEEVSARIKAGASYRDVLAALFLAAVRNVQPRPAVGFKFHAVLCVNSCHLAALSGPDSDRWLPILWAIDYFKSAQADEAKRSGWRMKPVDESKVPDAAKAREMLVEALETWDEEKADAATAGLVRTAGATEIFNLFARYAARDFRAIGHKAIFLANAWRTLQVIGWEHAEPVLRSLSFALLNHEGDPTPAGADLPADRPWKQNAMLTSRIPPNWTGGPAKPEAVKDLLAVFREGSPSDAAETATKLLESGTSPQTIWDGVFVNSGELLMRQPGIVALHGSTTANAVRFLYAHAADEDLRKRLLLQACSFNVLFRDAAKGRGQLKDVTLDAVSPVIPTASGSEAVAEILADVSGNKDQAARKIEGYLGGGGDVRPLVDGARRMIFLKGRDSHDYKFSSAVLEDFGHVSPEWRNKYLAMTVYHLKGSGDRDNGLVSRIRSALG